MNTKIRLITRVDFGFHGPQPLIALAMLSPAATTSAHPNFASAGGAAPPFLPGRR